MTPLERRIERDLGQIAQRATPSSDAWSSILTRVDDQGLDDVAVQFTKEEVTVIDSDTPTTTNQRGKMPTRVVAGLLTAAAVVAITVVAVRDDDNPSPAEQPSATVPSRALFGTPEEQLAPGTYFVDEFAGSPTPRVFVTIGEGWHNTEDKWAIRNDVIGVIQFSRPEKVFVDACHRSDEFHAGPVTTLDGLVTALTTQSGWSEITTPADITVDGYAGKTFQRTASPAHDDCDSFMFISWADADVDGGWTAYEPGETEVLQVFDVNGTIIVINTRLKGDDQEASAAAVAAVLDSIRIEHR